MRYRLLKVTLTASLTMLVVPSDLWAGGGGRGGGYGGGYGGGGRGGAEERGGSSMGRSPSFSQPRPQTNEARPQGGSESASGARPPGTNSAGPNNRNTNSNNPNAGAAAAGAGYANRNQPGVSNAGAAAAGAGYSNRNQPGVSNAGAAAAGAGYSNRNQPGVSNAGAAAAGAGYANRNQPGVSNAGAAAAGAGYANRNQNPYSNYGAAAAGAAYANGNGYYGGSGAGYWNGNYGNGSMGAYGGMGMASPSYGYGSMPYTNPYVGSNGTGGQVQQPANNVGAGNPSNYDYSQPLNTAAAPPDLAPPTDPNATPAAQAQLAFRTGDYATAIQLMQQALGQMPNDVGLHEFLGLALFAQGNYEQAAAPLYAVLSVGPGWNWTTLIGNYADAGVYTGQIRGLEAFVKANPRSAKSQFVLAYHYISQGQGTAAIPLLKSVIALQPTDTVSAQILTSLLPPSPAAVAQTVNPANLPGVWVAQAPPNAKITLSISDDTNFTWAFVAPGKPPVTINGTYALNNGVLTLSGKDTPGGPLAGTVASTDDKHMSFKAVGGPPSDPGLQFVR